RIGRGRLAGDRDAALEDVAQPQHDLAPPPGLIERQGMRDEPLLQAFEVEVSAVPQQLGAMLLAPDLDGVASQQVQQFGKYLRAATLDRRRHDGRWAKESLAI